MQKQRHLVLAAGSLGDSLLTLPALRQLASQGPVTVAGTAPFLSLGSDLFGIESMVPLDPLLQDLLSEGPWTPGTRDLLADFTDLHLFFKDPDTRIVKKLSTLAGPRVHGPRRNFEDFLKEGRWAAEYWLETVLAGPVPGEGPFRQARLVIPGPLRQEGEKRLAALGLAAPFILHPGSGSPAKNSPLAFFKEAAQKITVEGGKDVLVLWGEAEERDLKGIQEAFQGIPKVKVLDQPLPLRETAAVLSLACGYLGNDSGITHLASACGTRTFALFNHTDAKVWGPQANFVILSALKGSLKA